MIHKRFSLYFCFIFRTYDLKSKEIRFVVNFLCLNLQVNGEDLRNVSHNEAVQVFLKAGGNVKMLVQHNAEAFYKVDMIYFSPILDNVKHM